MSVRIGWGNGRPCAAVSHRSQAQSLGGRPPAMRAGAERFPAAVWRLRDLPQQALRWSSSRVDGTTGGALVCRALASALAWQTSQVGTTPAGVTHRAEAVLRHPATGDRGKPGVRRRWSDCGSRRPPGTSRNAGDGAAGLSSAVRTTLAERASNASRPRAGMMRASSAYLRVR